MLSHPATIKLSMTISTQLVQQAEVNLHQLVPQQNILWQFPASYNPGHENQLRNPRQQYAVTTIPTVAHYK